MASNLSYVPVVKKPLSDLTRKMGAGSGKVGSSFTGMDEMLKDIGSVVIS
ncbi:hypothetical protein B0F87_1172 [Methylobacter tundripaludum]|uniref:Uncharacterized protein n=1 Tax=Methylobacter tundripaludum TaxID=173365 RepID=A0A2S6H525_9GAMM|nr:hypothetical protein [Methylobacter tundripaludum]PPK72520.1 hypothetical protein B0F87_1172 [Methylobacter tundripaludum]